MILNLSVLISDVNLVCVLTLEMKSLKIIKSNFCEMPGKNAKAWAGKHSSKCFGNTHFATN